MTRGGALACTRTGWLECRFLLLITDFHVDVIAKRERKTILRKRVTRLTLFIMMLANVTRPPQPLDNIQDFLAGTLMVFKGQYTRESYELLNAGSNEINMNGGVQKCMETTKYNTKSGRRQG